MSVLPRRSSLLAARGGGNGLTEPDGRVRVSVIIPTFNRAFVLPRAIQSVLNQTFQDFEIIVVDDGSRDGTADAVRGIDDPRVSLITLPRNRGIARARNAGIARARSEWVAFLDSDDEWLPEKLDRQLAQLGPVGDPETTAVYCQCLVVTDTGDAPPAPPAAVPDGDVFRALLAGKHILLPSAYVVRRSALLEVGGFDESLTYGEDKDLLLRLALAGNRFVGVPEQLVIRHEEEGLGNISKDWLRKLEGFRAMRARWGSAERALLGDEYPRWLDNRNRRLRRKHAKHVKRLVRKGTRAEAWRYTRRMLRQLPWGAPLVARAFALAVLGRRLYRALALPARLLPKG